MKECKTCKKEISKRAKSCPHCGELSASSRLMRLSIGLICLGILLLFGSIFIIAIMIAVV